MINRRIALERISLIIGGTMSAPLMAGVFGEKLNNNSSNSFTENQIEFISEMAEIIIPATDIPGAKAAHTERFIVKVLADCYPKKDQDIFKNGLENFEKKCKTNYNLPFIALGNDQKIEAIDTLSKEDFPFFKLIKELTVAGYFSSEIGATKALDYLPVPGKFIACMPLKKSQKAWAL